MKRTFLTILVSVVISVTVSWLLVRVPKIQAPAGSRVSIRTPKDSQGEINTLKLEMDVIQYIGHQKEPGGVTITDARWDEQRREVTISVIGPEEKYAPMAYKTLASSIDYFFQKRFTKDDHLIVVFRGTDSELIGKYADNEKIK